MTILFKTKLRKKLLSYFFTHSDENFYVREMASLIHEDAGNLSRELRLLEKEGLCVSSSRGKLKFYPEKCIGCLLCLKNCPTKAISGERKKVHVIDQAACIKCGACFNVCPAKVRAVSKYTGEKGRVLSGRAAGQAKP